MKGLWIGRRGVGLAMASKCHVEFLFHRMRGDRGEEEEEGFGLMTCAAAEKKKPTMVVACHSNKKGGLEHRLEMVCCLAHFDCCKCVPSSLPRRNRHCLCLYRFCRFQYIEFPYTYLFFCLPADATHQ